MRRFLYTCKEAGFVPRSLADAGIGGFDPFVKAQEIGDWPFHILRAFTRGSRFNDQLEAVLTLQLMKNRQGQFKAVAYTPEGDPVDTVTWTGVLDERRQQIVSYFQDRRNANEPLGPCQFEFVESSSGNDYARIIDYVPQRAAVVAAASAPAVNGRSAAPAAAPAGPTNYRGQSVPDNASFSGDDDLEDLPF